MSICGADESHDTIHSVSFTERDLNVKALATDLEDFDMLCKLANGDLFAQDAVYHKEWMTKYYTRYMSQLRKKRSEGKTSQSELEGMPLLKRWHMLLRFLLHNSAGRSVQN